MISDSVRMDAYVRALERSVRPGCIVLDIGTGVGIMALVAARLGAGKVIAVESDDVIEVARQNVRANGYDDRIELIQANSTELVLGERVDVIVSDLHGVLPHHTQHIRSIIEARTLLASDGVLIPRRDTVHAAVVAAPSAYRRHMDCWSRHGLGFDLTAARNLAANTWWKEKVEDLEVLSERVRVAVIDYAIIEAEHLYFDGSIEACRRGTAHGLAVWFNTELTEGEGFSNEASRSNTIYGNAFFPLEHPVDLERGDIIHIEFGAALSGSSYIWRWKTKFERQGTSLTEFRQSTALGIPLSSSALQRSGVTFVPKLTVEGEAVRLTLELMEHQLSLEEIALRVSEQYPRRFSDKDDGIQFVRDLALKYG